MAKGKRLRQFHLWYEGEGVWALYEVHERRKTRWGGYVGWKSFAISQAREYCRAVGRRTPCQLFIHNLDGRITAKGDSTYPRSADPRRSKG
jgi:hypothetical protein